MAVPEGHRRLHACLGLHFDFRNGRWPSLAGRCTMAAVIDARQRWVTEGGDSERRVRLVRAGLDLLIRLGTEFAPEKSR